MRLFDLIKLATRMFKVRPSRTFLTILGMGIGIAAILFLVSLGFGVQKTLLETITTADSLVSLDAYLEDEESNFIDNSVVRRVEKIPGVEKVSPLLQVDSQVKLGEFVSEAQLMLVDSHFLKFDGKKAILGDIVNDKEPDGAVISSALVKVFGKEPAEILDEVINFSYELAGDDVVLVQASKIIGIVESEDGLLYANVKNNQINPKPFEFSKLKIKCGSDKDIGLVKNQLSSMGFAVASVSDVIDEANKVFKIVRIVLALFGVIALAVSAIGMFNTMTVSLLERTEEIGIMKSIGASDRDILSMFVFESTLMGLLGGLAGIIIALSAGKLINAGVNLVAIKLGGAPMSLFFSPLWLLVFILLLAGLVGFLTGIIPARRAEKIDPLAALRYK